MPLLLCLLLHSAFAAALRLLSEKLLQLLRLRCSLSVTSFFHSQKVVFKNTGLLIKRRPVPPADTLGGLDAEAAPEPAQSGGVAARPFHVGSHLGTSEQKPVRGCRAIYM